MTIEFRIPHSEAPESLQAYLDRACPELDPEQIDNHFRSGDVSVSGRLVKNPNTTPGPGATVRLDAQLEGTTASCPDPETLARGEGWVAIDKPIGLDSRVSPDDPLHPFHYIADRLGIARPDFEPAWPLPGDIGGPMLIGIGKEAANKLRTAWLEEQLMLTYRAIVQTPPRASGALVDQSGALQIEHSTVRRTEGLSDLQLIPSPRGLDATDTSRLPELILDLLAENGYPVLGDRHRGGFVAPEPGCYFRLEAAFAPEFELGHSWAPGNWWPATRIVPPTDETAVALDKLSSTIVSPETLRQLLESDRTSVPRNKIVEPSGAEPGELNQIRDTNTKPGPYGIVADTDESIQIWTDRLEEAMFFEMELQRRIDRAIASRRDLIGQTTRTDLFRLIDGEFDRLPGMSVERIGPVIRVMFDTAALEGHSQLIGDELARFDPDMPILMLRTRRDGVESGGYLKDTGLSHITRAAQSNDGNSILAREAGFRIPCNPWSPQLEWPPHYRAARHYLRRRTPGVESWLNLTGNAVSLTATLLARGAEVVGVGSSRLRNQWLERFLDFNTLSADLYESRSALDGADPSPTFEGLILDFDSVPKKPAEPASLAETISSHLIANGRLVLCRCEYRGRPLEAYVGNLKTQLENTDRQLRVVERLEPPLDYSARIPKRSAPQVLICSVQ